MTTIQPLDFVGTLTTTSFTTAVFDVSRFTYVRTMFSASTDATFGYNWSMTADGSVDNYEEVKWFAAYTDAVHNSVPVRAKYLSISYYPAVAPSDIRCTHLFYDGSMSLSNLSNAGAGTQLYIKGTQQIKSVTSSDASINVVDNGTSIDVTATPTGSVYTYMTRDNITWGSGVRYSDLDGIMTSSSLSTKRIPVKTAGTLKNLIVAGSARATADNVTFKIYVNQVATALTVALSNPDAYGIDSVNTVPVVVGDYFSFMMSTFSGSTVIPYTLISVDLEYA